MMPFALAGNTVAEYTSVDVPTATTVPPALTLEEMEPVLLVATENGKFPVKMFPEATAILVAPDISPVTVTCRPILVYLPDDAKAPTTVTPAP